MSRSVLFWRPGGIGDALLSIPALQILQRHEYRVHFVGHPGAGSLLRRVGLVQSSQRQGSSHSADNIYTGAIEIAGRLGLNMDKRAISAMLGSPDTIVGFSTDAMGMSYAFESLGIPSFTAQHWQPPIGTHQSEFMVLALRNIGILDRYSIDTVKWDVPTPHIPYLNMSRSVLIAPGSGMEYKRWPLESYKELARKLQSLGYEPLVLQGPMESNLQYKREFIGSRVVDLSLEGVAGLVQHRPPFIGSDSGLTHLAALSGCPTIGLYGPTTPEEWGPIGEDVHVIRECQEEPSGAVRVCNNDQCMSQISVNQVLDIFIRKINKYDIYNVGGFIDSERYT